MPFIKGKERWSKKDEYRYNQGALVKKPELESKEETEEYFLGKDPRKTKEYKEYKKFKEEESRNWIHREQLGKIRGVQRLGFKAVNRRQSFWGGK